MTPYAGTRRLAKAAATYLAALAFPVVYLCSLYVGATWPTALLRGVLSSLLAGIAGKFLFFPLADALLSALAQAEWKRREGDE